MNKKLKIFFSVFLMFSLAISLVVISDFSETKDQSETTDAILLFNYKIPKTVFQKNGNVIRILILK